MFDGKPTKPSGAARISVREGNILGGRPRRGSGGGAPRTPENFENFQKISQENCKKWIILGDFSKNFKNPALNLRALDQKPNYVGDF